MKQETRETQAEARRLFFIARILIAGWLRSIEFEELPRVAFLPVME